MNIVVLKPDTGLNGSRYRAEWGIVRHNIYLLNAPLSYYKFTNLFSYEGPI
jgi:hypothetical protein